MATKPYTRLFTNNFIPKKGNVSPAISIGAGMQRCVRVRSASEGRITKLDVVQVSGTAANFTVELLKSSYPFPPDVDITEGTAAADNLALYRIVPSQTATAGNTVSLDSDNPGYNYLNMDGTPTNNQRYVYLVIIPAAASPATVWEATVGFALEVPV